MESSKNKSDKEGLIPVTCKILRNLGKKEDKLEYMGVSVGEVVIVGFATKFEEQETKIIVGLWDQTGYIEVTFYNKNESDIHSGLEGYVYTEKGVIRVIGKVKAYKDSLKIDGARILNTSFNDFIYHKLEVITDWLYLTHEHNQDDVKHQQVEEKKGNKSSISNIINNRGNEKKENFKKVLMEILNEKSQTNLKELCGTTGLSEKEANDLINDIEREGLITYDSSSKEIYFV